MKRQKHKNRRTERDAGSARVRVGGPGHGWAEGWERKMRWE